MAERIFVGTRKGLFRIERRPPGRWSIAEASFLGVPVTMVLSDPRDRAIYAALKHGHFGAKLHRSKDGGATWEECAAPRFPEQEKNADGESLSVDQVWSLEPGHPSEPGVLWAGTIPGGLFRSADGGSSWSLIQTLWNHPKRKEWLGGGADEPGIHSICVDPRDGRRVLIGVSCGGVWMTTNGGETWEIRSEGMYAEFMPPERKRDPYIQDPHRVVMCPSAPDHLWCQHHNAAFRSTDGGKSWSDLVGRPPSVFGFAVAVHPRDPNRAWFVPAERDEMRIPIGAKVVVTRTLDGGRTYEVLDRGLPGEHAYDLVYRHALDIDDTGDRLAFGSTTGSLWVTEDQGGAWSAVSHHLPPINCVRFEAAQ
jgi:photosystem II stability/assembly factor-like uncharacterized protein